MDVPLYALLVGIADYPHPSLSRLYGPVNDVTELQRTLVDELGVPAEHVRTLTDGEATREAIEAAFRSHLHARGQAWVASGASGPPPAFLFAFSGHGSQAPDGTGTESDGFEETLVPYDGRESSVYDIKDHELAGWLAALPGDNVTVVLDCCHSGSGTRRPGPPPAPPGPGERPRAPDDAVRSAPPDLRPQPVTRVPAPGATRGLSLHGSGRHVLLAACRDHEEAFEHRGPDGRVRGALSAFATPALLAALARSGTTYRELHQMVRFDVNRARPRQTPVCEGDLDRVVFSSRRLPPEPGLVAHVIGIRDGQVWFDAGEVHGITLGTRLRLRDPEADTVTVEHLEPTRCAGRPATPDRLPPRGTRAGLDQLDLGDQRWRLHAEGTSVDLAKAVEPSGPLAGLVQLTDDPAEADLTVTSSGDGALLRDATGRSLVEATAPGAFLAAVAHVARAAHLLRLERPDLGPGLQGEVELSIDRAVEDPVSGELRTQPLATDDGGTLVATPGDRLVFEVRSTATVPVYAGLVAVTADWQVVVLHPAVRGAEDRVRPEGSHRIGLGTEAFTAALPPDRIATTDLVRALITTKPTSFDALALDPPPGTWHDAGPLPPPEAGRGGLPPPAAGSVPSGVVPSRWATASLRLTTRQGVQPVP